jgi:osmotically-inducible protein OsmY
MKYNPLPHDARNQHKEEQSMTSNIRKTRNATLTFALAGVLLSLPQISFAAGRPYGVAAQAQEETAAVSRLNKKQFKDVKVSIENGIATLSGTVDLYEYKADAEKAVHKVKGVEAIRNLIQVAGPTVPDNELKAKLGEKLAYDRVGYPGETTFNAITIGVENGVVTLAGHARFDWDKDSAVSLVSTYPGVKDVINDIEVDPTSIMDDQTRIAVARAVYGNSVLNKYAIDPAKPIRISVQNGHVELYGVVDSDTDKNIAFIQANSVPGVFSVKNYLQVANQSSEKKQTAVQ